MSSNFITSLILILSLLMLTPLSAFPEQNGPRQSEQQRVSGKLIPPRQFTISQESLDQLAKTPRKVPILLTAQENAAVQDIVTAIRTRNPQSTNNRWLALLNTLDQRGVPVDIGELIQYVLRESYLQSTQDLQKFADKIKSLNARKKQIQDELAKLRQQQQPLSAGKPAQRLRDGTKSQTADNIKMMEDKLASIGDDAQLANIDMQNALQKQQQVIQMMSNISKLLSDTAMAVIRKIGG